eukprot:366400-Chlamydomonas_euryale.AAC.5
MVLHWQTQHGQLPRTHDSSTEFECRTWTLADCRGDCESGQPDTWCDILQELVGTCGSVMRTLRLESEWE